MIHGRITKGLALFFVCAISSRAANAVSKSEPEAVPGEYIVKLKNLSRELLMRDKSDLKKIGQQLGGQVKSTIPEDMIVVIKKATIETRQSVIIGLTANPLVEVAEPNFIYHIEKTPNDPLFGNLWGLKNVGQADSAGSVGVSGVDIDVEKAWNLETGSKEVLIAVIDTGLDYNHPDLKGSAWVNEAEQNGKPGIDDDGNGYIDDIHGYRFTDDTVTDPLDDHGHGSHCSGTIGAQGDDGKGIVGVNWVAKIMPVKFLSKDGGGTLENAIRAIDYATLMGAKIMSNSWGGGGYSETLKQAIERANASGALFVVAAGNDGGNNDQNPHYPSSYDVPNILSVAAIDNQGNLATFSNFGKKSVHIAAPGVKIFSSIPNSSYDSWSGTSMATPHVSGVAALIAAHFPQMTSKELKERIIATARPLTNVKSKVQSRGMVNAYNALTNTVAPPDPNDPENWSAKAVSVSSSHPYKSKTKEEYEIQVSGAKEIAVYFDKFDTEKGYDTVALYSKSGQKIAEYSGSNDETYSSPITGDYVKIVFTSDDSLEGQGFDITKIGYR